MKQKHVFLVVPVVLLACLVIVMMGYAVGQGRGMGMERGVAGMMRQIPDDSTYFTFVDAKALRGDKDLKHLYEGWRDNPGYTLDDYGIVTDDVEHTAMGISLEGERYYLIDGDFDLREVRDKLDSLGLDEGEYRGVELWERNGEVVVLVEDLVILSTEEDVRDSIEVIMGEKDSLWDNQDVKDIVDRLPDGINTKYISHPQYMSYEGMKAQGTSLEKKDEDTLNMIAVFMFEDEDAARHAVAEIKEDTGAEEIERSDVKQDGMFVILTIQVSTGEMFMFG